VNVKIIAEIGQNHNGDFNTAKRMIAVAAGCGVDYVKFQKRNPQECLSSQRYSSPYLSEHSFGATYGEHRERLELSIDAHHELKSFAEGLGVGYSCSVWDLTSFREVASLNPDYIKVPSAHNEDWKLLNTVFSLWKKPIHISNGMATPATEAEWARLEVKRGAHLIPYACTATYPAKMEDVKLLDIPRFLRECGWQERGFSGHHLGIALDMAAVTLGATWVERHFTLDRAMKGRDHAASLEPDALRKLVRDVHAVGAAMDFRRDVLPCEVPELPRKMKSEVA
jgi:N-acetylneuraminate synthase